MYSSLRRGTSVAAAIALLASLLVAGGALAQTPAPQVPVQVGPTATGQLSIDFVADAQVGASNRLDVQSSRLLVAVQTRLSTAQGQLTSAVQDGVSTVRGKVRALRTKVRSLCRRARRLARRVQQTAIAQARSAQGGAWLVVNASGTVVSQSGGMTVSRMGTGVYAIGFDASANTCLSSSSDTIVQVNGPSGVVDGGFFLASTCTTTTDCAGGDLMPTADNAAQVAEATLCLINAQRAAASLGPLRADATLTRASTAYARDMIARKYFAHLSPDGTALEQRLARVGYHYKVAGENIAWGEGPLATPASIVNAWMHSAGHRTNVLGRHFRQIGLGIALGTPRGSLPLQGATYVTDFGTPSRP